MPFIAAIQGIDLPSSGESFADAFRVFHGRGGCFPGSEHLTLDWYPPVLLLTSFREVSNTTLKMYKEELSSWWENKSQVELFLHEYNIALLGDTLTLPQKDKFKLS